MPVLLLLFFVCMILGGFEFTMSIFLNLFALVAWPIFGSIGGFPMYKITFAIPVIIVLLHIFCHNNDRRYPDNIYRS